MRKRLQKQPADSGLSFKDLPSAAAVFDAVSARSGKIPFMLCAKTTKGKGVSYMENVPIWHYRSPSKQEYQQAVIELEQAAR